MLSYNIVICPPGPDPSLSTARARIKAKTIEYSFVARNTLRVVGLVHTISNCEITTPQTPQYQELSAIVIRGVGYRTGCKGTVVQGAHVEPGLVVDAASAPANHAQNKVAGRFILF